jgi:dipeptidyl aminopeptidase/acylaminoacyl peptidase
MKHHLASVSGWLPGLVIAFAVLSALPAQAGEQLFTPDHIAQLRDVAEVAISPDGTRLGYVLRVPRRPGKDADGPTWAELHVVDVDGTSRPFVTGEVEVSKVAWTPEGKAISFLAKREGDDYKALYMIPADGGESRRLIDHLADIKEYSWSPDGKRVAFLAEEAESEEKKALKEKGFKQEVFEEDWKPVRVWLASLDDPSSYQALDLPGPASELHWSPVDARLLVALAPTPSVDDRYMNRKLHVVDADSGDIVVRIDSPGKLGEVAWSPDGNHLAFISAADLHDPKEGRLMVVSTTGGSLLNVLPEYEGHVSAIAWQDADTVMFITDEGVWTALSEVRRDGSARKVIVPTGGVVLTDLRLSADGQNAAFLGNAPQHPAEVFFMAHGDAAPQRLTDSNPWLADMQFARQEVVTYQARDGLRLQGLLIRPLNWERGRRYPLIVSVHGGPESHRRQGWLTTYRRPGQLAAAHGFAVFYPNYRASTGRGVEFSKLDHGDFAGKEFDDLVDGVDYLVESGLVDRTRVAITGSSYGGYATAWGATYYSDRFAAAVMFVGISDNISKVGTTDIPNEMYLVHHRMRPWENWDLFRQRSPLYHVQKCRTPILILGGTADTRVHPSQSLEFYRYLKLLGQAPIRLVRYPGEKHGNRRAAARYDYNLRMLRWVEHYLKGPGGDPPPYELDYDGSGQ